MPNIIETAKRLGFFKVFVSAVGKAGLESPLQEKGPFTIFAPTDQAFAKLPPGKLEDLMNDPMKLRAVLVQHIAEGRSTTDDAVATRKVKNAVGEFLMVNSRIDGIYVSGARVVEADMLADNGIIHAVDTLLARGV